MSITGKRHVCERYIHKLRKQLAGVLILSLLAALVLPYGRLQVKAEGTGPHIKMPVLNAESSGLDIMDFEPDTVSGNYAAFTQVVGQSYYAYNADATEEEAASAPVSYEKSTGILTLNNYVYDYSGLLDSMDTVIESNGVQLMLHIKGNCSLTNNGSSPLVYSDSNLIITGDSEGRLTLTTTGRALSGDEPVPPIALSGVTTTLSTDVSLILNSAKVSDGSEAGYWDIGMEGEGFTDRIIGVDKITGVYPTDEDGGYSNICIEPDGTLFGEKDVYLKIADGKLVDTTAEADDYNFHYTAATSTKDATIALRNFEFTSSLPEETIAPVSAIGYYATTDGTETGETEKLKLVLEGTNCITCPVGSAMDFAGDLEITGSGSLTAVTTCGTGTPDEENPEIVNYTPAIYVGGDNFICETILTCTANNAGEQDMVVNAPVANTIIRGNGQVNGRVMLDGQLCGGLQPYTTECADISGFDFVGKAYYFVSQQNLEPGTEEYNDALKYPNHIIKDLGEEEWRIIGRYDENGNPIPATSYYQGYYVLKNGGVITNDFHYPVMYLIYFDEDKADGTLEEIAAMDAKMTSSDIVYVGDGKTHTFNTDLYGLQMVSGNATVNGNVTLDLACFEQYGIAYIDQVTGEMDYRRDESGNIIYVGASSEGASVTVNGNVGCLSLNKSYRGNATVTGNANYIAYYDDVNAQDRQPVPETFYGSLVNAGKVVDNGTFTDKVTELQGFKDFGMYENTCYAKTENIRNGETVKGTTAPVGEDALLVNVGANGIGEKTYPCVRESDSSTLSAIKGLLPDKTSKITSMDITLIQDDTAVVEPTQTVNLYLDNLSGFRKPALFHIKDDGTIEKLYAFSGSSFDGMITCPTGSFSTYFVAENQELGTTPEADTSEDTSSGETASENMTPDWNSVQSEVKDNVAKVTANPKSENVNMNLVVSGENKVPAAVLKEAAGKNVTLAFHSGNGVALSISGQDVTGNSLRSTAVVDLTVNSNAHSIPESVVNAKSQGSARNQQISIKDSGAFPVKVNLHVGVGVANSNKYANLYRYNAAKNRLEYCGSFRITNGGQAMFGLRRGGEYLVTVTTAKPKEKVVYSEDQYTVQAGDSLSAIARKNNLSLAELLRRNPQITNAGKIYPGQKINMN